MSYQKPEKDYGEGPVSFNLSTCLQVPLGRELTSHIEDAQD